jgi:hypothetical protein
LTGTDIQEHPRVTYQPQTSPINPKPPPTCRSFRMWARSASEAAEGMAASAAAMKENNITRPKKSRTKSKLTRNVPIKITKLTKALFENY